MQAVSADLYARAKENKQKGATEPSKATADKGKAKDDVIDADFEMVDDKDKKST